MRVRGGSIVGLRWRIGRSCGGRQYFDHIYPVSCLFQCGRKPGYGYGDCNERGGHVDTAGIDNTDNLDDYVDRLDLVCACSQQRYRPLWSGRQPVHADVLG